jgi:GAF domain-containing protein
MLEPRFPDNEILRRNALEKLGILFTPEEERFDRITRLACSLFDVPIALISLISNTCQWFKSHQGLEATTTDRNISFCAHAILSHEPFIVSDTSLDKRFADNPLVSGDPFIKFYAGIPIREKSGMAIGTLCIIDRKPRSLNAMQLDQLKDLAHWVELEINLLE